MMFMQFHSTQQNPDTEKVTSSYCSPCNTAVLNLAFWKKTLFSAVTVLILDLSEIFSKIHQHLIAFQ